MSNKGTIRKRRVITDEVPYCIFDGTNFREIMQFAKSRELRARLVDGECELTLEVDRAFYKISKDDVLVDFGDELVCKSAKTFEEFIAENQSEPKDWFGGARTEILRKWLLIADIRDTRFLSRNDLVRELTTALNHIEELQNILKDANDAQL